MSIRSSVSGQSRDAIVGYRTFVAVVVTAYFTLIALTPRPWATPAINWAELLPLSVLYLALGIFGFERPHDVFPKARAAAARALALDPNLGEAHAALAHELFTYEWNWKASEESFKTAIALGPKHPMMRLYYAAFLWGRGRGEEALSQLRVMRELDPLGPTGLLSGRVYLSSGRPDEAIRLLEPAQLDLDVFPGPCAVILAEPRHHLMQRAERFAFKTHALGSRGQGHRAVDCFDLGIPKAGAFQEPPQHSVSPERERPGLSGEGGRQLRTSANDADGD